MTLLETGKGIPDEDQRRRLARKLGIDPADLLKPVIPMDTPQSEDVTA